MSQKNKLIKVLTVFFINITIISIFNQCRKADNDEFSILFQKNKTNFSFIIETPKNIYYSTSSFSELKNNTLANRKNLIFTDELKKLKTYNISSEKREFQNLFISNTLGETNFALNHLFEFDIKIENSKKVFANIYYPYNLKGSYEFVINDETKDIINRVLYKLSSEKSLKFNTSLDNVIIIENKSKKQVVFGEDYFISNSAEYSLLLAISNKILLENINKSTIKINKLDFPTKTYIKHFELPPLLTQQ